MPEDASLELTSTAGEMLAGEDGRESVRLSAGLSCPVEAPAGVVDEGVEEVVVAYDATERRAESPLDEDDA